MQEGQADFARWALSGEDIVLNFQHILKGEMIQPKTRTERTPTGDVYGVQELIWVSASDPLLNPHGIQQMTSLLYSFLNRSVFLSNLTELRSMGLSQRILLSANKKLLLSTRPVKDKDGNFQYHEDGTLKTMFDMKPEDFEQIISQLEGILIPSMLRAYQEGERKFFAHTESTVRQIVGSDRQAQPQGLFGGGQR